jgi:hypothetical protein
MKFFLTYCSLLLAAVAFFKQEKDLYARLLRPEAQFIVPDGVVPAPPGYIGWQEITTTLCRSQLYLAVRNYEFGYRVQKFLLGEKYIIFCQLSFAHFYNRHLFFPLSCILFLCTCIQHEENSSSVYFFRKAYENEDELNCRLCSLVSTPSFNSTLPLARSLPAWNKI